MNKITFEDLPSTNTPINAENLNLMQGNIEISINENVDVINAVNTKVNENAEEIENLKTHIVTTEGTDLNDYTTEGRYYFGIEYTPKNVPNGVNGLLEVFVGTSFIKQIWYRHGTPNTNDFQIYIRTKVTEVWSNWKQYAMTEVKNVADRAGCAQIGGLLVQWGYINGLTVPATSYATHTITFDKTFTTVPSVVVTPGGNYNIKADVQSTHKERFNMNIRSLDNAERTDRSFYWIAIGT